MEKMIAAFWKICRLKLGPQDLPASQTLMLFSALAYGLVNALGNLMIFSPGQALISSVLDVALFGAMTQLLLWIKQLTPRFQQTFTALMGSSAIIVAIALPFTYMQMQLPEPAVLPALLILGLIVWNLTVIGHILRHAIDAPMFVGVLLALVFMYVSISVMQSLFPITS